jgi:hypothetical protein
MWLPLMWINIGPPAWLLFAVEQCNGAAGKSMQSAWHQLWQTRERRSPGGSRRRIHGRWRQCMVGTGTSLWTMWSFHCHRVPPSRLQFAACSQACKRWCEYLAREISTESRRQQLIMRLLKQTNIHVVNGEFVGGAFDANNARRYAMLDGFLSTC